ncbi:ABC transporter [Methylobacterium terricola]|uniref:ABC transporter n=1 Tax=Methylobacterium terricola TaxID=2583531 RepID=A0A5C4L892_9HYPH|nr:glycine betaine ABC transporter substrate-binding protein [Methylobacterium terricola]TNC06426.1 ABC transporter [Methylobacterium terricola]
MMAPFKHVLSAALVVAGLTPAFAAEPIKVGSKNFTEQYIVAEMYAAVLKNAGLPVEKKLNLGGTLIAHQALTSGQIDVYPEYTGTGLNAVVKGPVSSDPDEVYRTVKAFYEKEFKVTWLKPSGINNGYVMVVRKGTADKYGLKTLSDLAKVSKELVIGAGPEFPDRADGLPGLKRVYGAEFKAFKQFAKLGLRYDALAQEGVDVVNASATDAQLASAKLAPLQDDKGLFPPYYLAPVARTAMLEAYPKASALLEAVGAKLDNAVMRDLNAKVENDREEPAAVAVAYLKKVGLLP